MRRRAAATVIPVLVLGALLLVAPPPVPAGASRLPAPADPRAGGAATDLLQNLTATQEPGRLDGFLFGQQHANWDSKRYRAVEDRVGDWRAASIPIDEFGRFVSDIELATLLIPGVSPRRPAVYGFNLQTALNLDPEGRIVYADRIVDAYAAGGVVTIHFPADNPVTGGSHRDLSANLLCLLSTDWTDPPPDASPAVDAWRGDLETAADFLRLVNIRWRDPDDDGVDERSGRVAAVFRPYHEMLRASHWWSAAHYRNVPDVCDGSAAAAFHSLWRQTIDYLTAPEHLNLHGLLFAWSPDRPSASPGWERFYPNADLDPAMAADYVDVIAFDVYDDSSEDFSAQLVADTAAVAAFNAALPPEFREVIAVGEFGPRFGLSTVSEANWFMRAVVEPLTRAGLADQIAYAMTWTNRNEDSYWVPLPCFNVPECEAYDIPHVHYRAPGGDSGDPLRGFRAFVNHPATVFLEDLPPWWRRPDPTIPFQPGDSPRLILQVACWLGYDHTAPDLYQRLDACPLPTPIGRAGGLRR
jgi:hypothetical protein